MASCIGSLRSNYQLVWIKTTFSTFIHQNTIGSGLKDACQRRADTGQSVCLRLLTHVGFLRQNGLILSDVFCVRKEARIKKKIHHNRAKKFHLPEEV